MIHITCLVVHRTCSPGRRICAVDYETVSKYDRSIAMDHRTCTMCNETWSLHRQTCFIKFSEKIGTPIRFPMHVYICLLRVETFLLHPRTCFLSLATHFRSLDVYDFATMTVNFWLLPANWSDLLERQEKPLGVQREDRDLGAIPDASIGWNRRFPWWSPSNTLVNL